MELKTLTAELSVAPQIAVEDVAELARHGFRSIIGNRPDGEEPGQPAWSEIAATARRHGLSTRHIPVVASRIDEADVRAFRQALQALPKPAVAFCRTGTRSTILWALANPAGLASAKRIQIAAGHGFDVAPVLSRFGTHSSNGSGEETADAQA